MTAFLNGVYFGLGACMAVIAMIIITDGIRAIRTRNDWNRRR